MSKLIPEVAERAALGPGDGYDSQLVTVTGTQHSAGTTARNYIRRIHGVPVGSIMSEYAGRDDHGDPVYLVTWEVPT